MLPRNTGHGPKPKCLAATPAVLFVCIWMSANVWIGIVLQTFDYSISTATWSIDVITFSSKVKEKEEIKDESMYGFRRYNGGKMISLNSEDLKHVVIQRGHLSHQNINHSSSFYLPEALRPIQTFNASPKHRLIPKDNRTINDIFIEENCCQMALDKMNNKKISQDNYCWQAICHTPRACNDSLYPFSSQHEKDYFQLRKLQRKEKKKFKRQCNSRNGMLVPPYTWCKQWFEHDKDESTVSLNHTKIVRGSDRVTIESVLEESSHQNLQMLEHYNYKNINPYEAKLPPPGCSHFTEGGGSGSYVNLFLFPQAKLAFCGIYKGGNTQWRQFLRFTLGAKDYQANPHSKRDQHLFSFDLMREEIQTEILNDPEWKFAVFLRDPAERLLSAYLDKMGRRVNTTEVEHYRKVFNFTETPSFAEFLETIAMNRTKCPGDKGSRRDNLFGVDWCSDIHWRPQTMACGISEFLPRISYIGSLDRVASQTRAILSKVNLWESYGKYFHWDWKRSNFSGSDESTVCATPPPQLNVGDRLIGFQQKVMTSQPKILRHGANHHATGSQSKIDEFYTPRLRQLVREIYRKDYELWDLVRNRDEIMSGSELAMMVSGDCQRAATRLVRDGELKSFTA